MEIKNIWLASSLTSILVASLGMPVFAGTASEALMKMSPNTPVTSTPPIADDSEWRKPMDKGKAAYNAGQFAEAESAYNEALKVAESKSKNNYMVILALNSLGSAMLMQKKFQLAEETLKKANELCAASNYPAELRNSVKASLGDYYALVGKVSEAKPLLEQSGQFVLENEGKYTAPYAASLDNQAVVLKKQGRLQESEEMHKEALKIWEKVKGTSSSDYAICLTNLAVLYGQQKRYADAETFFNRALAINEKLFSDSDPRLAETYQNLGMLALYQDKLTEADQYFEKDIKIRKKMRKDGLAAAEELNLIGLQFSNSNKHEAAISYFEKALAIREKELPKDSIETAKTIFNIAVRRIQLKQYGKAEELLKRAKEICEKNKPSMVTVSVMNAYADVLSRTGRQMMAVEMAKKAKEMKKTLSP